MKKTYVLDTNVLLYNPEAIFAFEDNEVVIPLAVIEEIDNQKKRQDEIGRNARVFSKQLDAIRSQGRLSEGVSLSQGGIVRVEINHQDLGDFSATLDLQKYDNRILAVAHYFSKTKEEPVILVTKDLNLRRYFQHYFWPLMHGDSTNWGIRALNKEQKFAFELLSDDHLKVVTLVGNAGTGKTLLALAVGLEKVVEHNHYTRLLITCPVIPMGQDLGYLPGTKEEKLRPWMQPIFDNLEFLSANAPEPFEVINDLKYKGLIELEALTYIRGRSIPKQFIICDEAQNLSPHMIKTLITRVGKGTKIVTLVRGEHSQVAELGSRLL